MRYIGGQREAGCVFCNRLHATDDVASLIVARSRYLFIILNLFPYNTGHLMLVPNEHLPTPETASDEVLTEMGLLMRATLRALRRALGCDGFNVGFNIGAVAGAGVAEHLHQHVVPRWTGDANFMPILAGTKVIPELLSVTYAKIRAEVERELSLESSAETPSLSLNQRSIRVLVLSHSHQSVLVTNDQQGRRLPTAVARHDEPLWRAALRVADDISGGADLVDWAGPSHTGEPGASSLAFAARDSASDTTPPGQAAWMPVEEVGHSLADASDRLAVERAVHRLSGPSSS